MIYFGTRDRMRWVKAPAVNTPLSKAGWSNVGTDLNGGGFAKLSPTAHKEYEFTWGASPAQDIYDILDYRSGAYGLGFLYYLDPFAMETNAFSEAFSMPKTLCAIGRIGGSYSTPTGGRLITTNLETNPRFATNMNIPAPLSRELQPDGSYYLINPAPASVGYGQGPYGQTEYGY